VNKQFKIQSVNFKRRDQLIDLGVDVKIELDLTEIVCVWSGFFLLRIVRGHGLL
jgi:hypothetical protein